MRSFCKRLIRDEGGSIVVWTTAGLLGFIGMGALLLDGGRMLNLHSQMKAYADHVALAAAAELDGSSDAIARAVRAATGGSAGPIVTDTQNYSFGGSALAVSGMKFLSKLGTGLGPAGADGDVIQYTHSGGTPSPTAAQSQLTRFVEVTIAPRNVTYVMAPVLATLGFGTEKTAQVSAIATAGFTRAACRFPPMMICNPSETNPGDPFNWQAMIGKQVLMKAKGNGAAWEPGDFGLLDLADFQTGGNCTGGGGSLIRCVLGLVDPGTQCVLQGGEVDLKPGETIGPTHTGMNIRFDIWDPPFQGQSDRNNPAFAPARNVIKGRTHTANQCRMNDLTDGPSVALPRDAGLSNANRIGSGLTLTQAQTYWSTNHPTVPWPFAGTPTRYEMYRKEIALNTATNGESMAPTCATPVTEPADLDPVRDRRVLLIAVINCKEHNVHGATDNVPVENFALMFMTEPIGLDDTNVDDVYGEMIGIVKANTSNGVLHEFPVLYR